MLHFVIKKLNEASWWVNDNKNNTSASGTKKTKDSQVNALEFIHTENVFQIAWRQ